MQCGICAQKAISDDPALCSEHFKAFVQETVAKTVAEEELFSKKDRICVAVSGGKDSLSLLHILTTQGYAVEALAIDEGINGYRE
ncbi:MAG: hypothetical protein ABIH41_03805, partial [Nanoarchaeota archaeon]